MYVAIFFGNITIFAAISQDSHLHTPMYIFLMNLSALDISLSSTALPNVLRALFTQQKHISFPSCIAQMYVFVSLLCTEIFLLSAMAYDRYVAICHPLHYDFLMSLRHCAASIATSWTLGFLAPTVHTVLISGFSFCASHVIEHFYCDVTPLLKLSCSDTSIVELLTNIEGILVALMSFLLTLISYIFIICTILNIRSVEGRQKAFSTCTSHLTCVIIFYITSICLHMRPTSDYSPTLDKYFSLINVILIPMLNPVIYSLKNKEVKHALNKLKTRLHICFS
ncbi:olfactory receptor 6F1-like [Discoglossus pictus]